MGIFDVSIPDWLKPMSPGESSAIGRKIASESFDNAFNQASRQRMEDKKLAQEQGQFEQTLDMHKQMFGLQAQKWNLEQQIDQIKLNDAKTKIDQTPAFLEWNRKLGEASSVIDVLKLGTPPVSDPTLINESIKNQQERLKFLQNTEDFKNQVGAKKSYEDFAHSLAKEGLYTQASAALAVVSKPGPLTDDQIKKLSDIGNEAEAIRTQRAQQKVENEFQLKSRLEAEKQRILGETRTPMTRSEAAALDKELSGTSDLLKKAEIIRRYKAEDDPQYKKQYEGIVRELGRGHAASWWPPSLGTNPMDEFGNPLKKESIPPADKAPKPKVDSVDMGLRKNDKGNYVYP